VVVLTEVFCTGIAAFNGKIGTIAERADPRFFWNQAASSVLLGTLPVDSSLPRRIRICPMLTWV